MAIELTREAWLVKKIAIFISCTAVTLLPLRSFSIVTLEEAYRSALGKTETTQLARNESDQSRARINKAKSPFLPDLSLTATYQRKDPGSAAAAAQDQTSSKVTLYQSLFAGGGDWARLKAREAENAADRWDENQIKAELYAKVAHSYFDLLSTEADLENLKQIIKFATDRLAELSARVKIGRSRNIELLAAQAQISVLRAQQIASEGQLAVSRDRFSLLTGLPLAVEIESKLDLPPQPKDIKVYLAEIEKRSDIAALKSQVESAQMSVRAAYSGHLPTLGLTGNYYLKSQPQQVTAQANPQWDASLILTLPIYSGGATTAEIEEGSARQIQAELLLQQTRREAESAIRTAHQNLTSSLQQLEALEAALKSTEQNYKEQTKNYRYGQATNLDVLQALNLYQETKRTLDRTRAQALESWVDLRVASAEKDDK